jgi:8-oxo-dGTP pyrophosphatase MutT (NUDIX family)
MSTPHDPEVGPALLPRLRAALDAAPTPSTSSPGIAAAVLVPLFLQDGALHLLYTKRSETLPHHRGQVSFPGGRHVADADPTMLATALRETEEEIGVAPVDVEVLGALPPIHTLGSNFLISPFVGVFPHPYEFRANPYEVSEIFSVPLAVLLDPATATQEDWTADDGRVLRVAAYRHGKHMIWGATYAITTSLLELVQAMHAGA